MKLHSPVSLSQKSLIALLVTAVFIIAATVGWGEYRRIGIQKQLAKQIEDYNIKFAILAEFASSTSATFNELNTKISGLTNESVALSGAIQNTQSRNEAIQEQVGKVSSTVGSLDKLSKTDPQLLQKYSKVYFLNEHYVPPSLSTLPVEFSSNKDTKYQVHSSVYPKLESMLRAAKAENMNLLAVSAYRSFGTQAALKSSYKVTYGAGTANQFSADQGYSEHQLGTTLDFTTPKIAAADIAFESTLEFAWLVNNAHKYGFTLSYPKGNKYYIYEPWHWRYVGVDLATRLKRDGIHFYDLDQRVIDNYLLLIFD